jgi:hypothetical protein
MDYNLFIKEKNIFERQCVNDMYAADENRRE